MNTASIRTDDPGFEDIVSPLNDNRRLREIMSALAERERQLQENNFADGDASEFHFAEMELVANHLVGRNQLGRFDRWDWHAMFVSDDDFRGLYPAEGHSIIDDLIRNDANEFVSEPDWEETARSGMSLRERRNLLTVLDHFDAPGWGSAMAALQRFSER